LRVEICEWSIWHSNKDEAWKVQAISGTLSIMADSVNDNPQDPAQQSLADILVNLPAIRAGKRATALSRVDRRLIEPAETEQDNERFAFQHTVFCQTSLPYRDPGDDVREWQREQGMVSLLVEAGQVRHPRTQQWIKVGLPWGPCRNLRAKSADLESA
jgi:hypothetical protein